MPRILIFIALLLSLTGCSSQTRLPEARPAVTINSLAPAITAPYPAEQVVLKAVIENHRSATGVWLRWQVCDGADQQLYESIQSTELGNRSSEQAAVWVTPADLPTARYSARLQLWDKPPDDLAALQLAELQTSFLYFRRQAEFNQLDRDIWGLSNKRLGKTRFRPKQVTVQDGQLRITIPAGKFESGEIRTLEPQQFGIFEARMQLPLAPGSITGFFLYQEPDYYYEIDIEVTNQSEATVWLSTYADGAQSNLHTAELNFDPTAGFHNYRIEHCSSGVACYVDDILLGSWSVGCPTGPMQLMLNCWYPDWLEGEPPLHDQQLLVEWIRY